MYTQFYNIPYAIVIDSSDNDTLIFLLFIYGSHLLFTSLSALFLPSTLCMLAAIGYARDSSEINLNNCSSSEITHYQYYFINFSYHFPFHCFNCINLIIFFLVSVVVGQMTEFKCVWFGLCLRVLNWPKQVYFNCDFDRISIKPRVH